MKALHFLITPLCGRALLLLIVTIMLVAGLRPEGYRFRNEVTWLEEGPGIQFGRFGIAHSQPFLTPAAAAALNRSGFTLVLGIQASRDPNSGYQFIAAFHNGDDESQLVIGQWQDYVIIMNGDDYPHVRRLPRISARLDLADREPRLLTVSTATDGTRLFIDGDLAAHQPGLHLKLPEGSQSSLLVMGNSVHAQNGWPGTMSGFALLPGGLALERMPEHFANWQATRNLAFLIMAPSSVLLLFDEKVGNHITDHSVHMNHVMLPPYPVATVRSFFADDAMKLEFDASSISDVTLNLFGFVPFGFALAALLHRQKRRTLTLLVMVTIAAFLFSLGIETVQAWMPSRSSSPVDLLLNTAGGFAGAWIFWRLRLWFLPASS